VEDQFLLGPDLLVAPILARGAVQRGVYLPPGPRWIDLWSGRRVAGGRWVWAEAPLGRIPVYLRDDAVLCTFDVPVDTLVRRTRMTDRSLSTLDDAEGSLALFVGPAADGRHGLWDGTSLDVETGPMTGADALPTGELARHALWPDALLSPWSRVGVFQGADGVLPLGDGRHLRVRGRRERRWSVYRLRSLEARP
jgi:hypothetical protein